jgi:hypothetical protein
MAAKGTQWKGGHPTAPKEQEHRPEIALQAVRLAGTPANKNAGKSAAAEAAGNGKPARQRRTNAPESDTGKPKFGKRPAKGAPGAEAGGERAGTDKGKREGKGKKGTPKDGTKKPNRQQPIENEPGDGAGGKKPKDPGKKEKKKSRGEKDKDEEPFKPSVTFGDITAAVAGAAESAAQFASGQVQSGAAFVTGG